MQTEQFFDIKAYQKVHISRDARFNGHFFVKLKKRLYQNTRKTKANAQ